MKKEYIISDGALYERTGNSGAYSASSPFIGIGQLALALHEAGNAVRKAKRKYHEAIDRHEFEHGRIPRRIDPFDDDFAPLLSATKSEFDAYQAAKRIAYNIKRRLENACRKAGSVA